MGGVHARPAHASVTRGRGRCADIHDRRRIHTDDAVADPAAPYTNHDIQSMPIRIRRAVEADAHALTRLATHTFRETFEQYNTAEDMAHYLAESFSPSRQAAEIADATSTMLLAEHVAESGAGELVGYAQLVSGPAPEAVSGPAPLELRRFYVTSAWHGRGVAQALMGAVLDAARSRGAETLWLGVWERNPRAVAFYSRYGFTRVGEHTFMLGSDAQTDWLFARPMELP